MQDDRILLYARAIDPEAWTPTCGQDSGSPLMRWRKAHSLERAERVLQIADMEIEIVKTISTIRPSDFVSDTPPAPPKRKLFAFLQSA